MNKGNRIFSAAAIAFFASGAASAQAPEGAYRGMIVCEKIAIARDILHVPFDLIVRGQTVAFARPVFNLKGNRIVGSELGTGSIDSDGKLHATSTRIFLGQTVESDYSGSLTADGGTLSGRQSWHGSNGEGSRNCHIALVPAPKPQKTTGQEQK